MKKPTKEQQRALVRIWDTAGPELERIRREELRGKPYCWKDVDTLLDAGDHYHGPPRETSGLVEMQRLFMKAARKQGRLPYAVRETPGGYSVCKESGAGVPPANFREAAGTAAPHCRKAGLRPAPQLYIVGDPAILPRPKIALFCSVKCPGKLILETYDLAKRLRVEGALVISPFHSPMEQECLRILLRSPHPVIWALARGVYSKIPSKPVDCRPAVAEGRLIMVTPFPDTVRHITAETATIRNRLVAELASAVVVAHAAPGSKMEALCRDMLTAGKPLYTFDHPANAPLLQAGAKTVGHLYPEHFSGKGSPKKTEAVSDASRHNGDQVKAKMAYEDMMSMAFGEAVRALKPGGIATFVYAHKTTLGWATLVDALRRSGCEVVEAWPMDTEMKARLLAMGTAALASSIFLVARKRDATSKAGNYEADVVPELENIVRERVETLWEVGISGADLVIACVGAGLRAFTKYPRVEFANGEEVPAERFLSEVEAVVLETILGKLSKTVGAKAGLSAASSTAQTGETLSGLDPATRFYVLWRYTYGGAELDSGEAIIFANGTHVDLDGPHGLSAGTRRLVEKKKGKYKLLDFTGRGDDDKLGMPEESQAGSLCHSAIDALHRLLWLVEHKPPKIPDFLNEAKPNVEQLRLVAQALAGPALKGGELADVSPTAEQSALGKLLANWNAVMVGKEAVEDRRKGQATFDFGGKA